MNWPNGADYALAISVDVDGDLPLLAENPANIDRHKSRSVGLYGPEHGLPRLLRVFDDLSLRAQVFFPGEIARRYPDTVRDVDRAGHSIGVHGNHHVDFGRLNLDEQIAEMLQGRTSVEQALGRTPHGFRTPAGEWADGFTTAMDEAGFRWSSSLPADELPFHLTGTNLIEIPFRYELEDQQYLGYNLDPPFPPGQSRITPLETVEENWHCEVRGAEHYGTLVHLRLNAEVMGIASRARMLHRFLGDILQRGNAWCATFDELHQLVVRQEADPAHPFALYTNLRAANL